ncbi:MAG: SRPBCC family protein [Desulfuromonadaceae bacterium]|nr:SRPBCC family protein [Desulfuromonadaceae bacterium]
MYRLERDIELAVSAEDLWQFVATPGNLNAITPPELHFEILTSVPERMYNGLMILYRVRVPLLGRTDWLTEIKHIRPGLSFVDEQRRGPYRLWYHYHEICALGPARSRMIDRVDYQLPFGPLGRMVHRALIGRTLERIFDYRSQALVERFGG